MDEGGAVRVQRALRVAGRARGVAKARRRVLVEQRPLVAVGLGREQRLIRIVHRHPCFTLLTCGLSFSTSGAKVVS